MSENFLILAASGLLNGTFFDRNIPSFFIQGGFSINEKRQTKHLTVNNSLNRDKFNYKRKFNKKGYIAVANKNPSSIFSQFIITYKVRECLNNTCLIFGKIISGWKILLKFEKLQIDRKYKII